MIREEVNNILIVKWGALGDIVMSTSAIKTIRDNFPASKITLVSNSLMAQILPPGYLVDEILFIKTKGNRVSEPLRNQLKLILFLRRRKFDLAVNLRWTSERAAMLTYLSGAKFRVSSGPKNVMNLYNIRAEAPVGRYHEVHRNLDIVKALDLIVTDETPLTYISSSDQESADDFFISNSLQKENTICIHPGASRPVRAWLPERFKQIAKMITEKLGAKIVITWGSEEEILARQIAEDLDNVIICKKTNSIGELAAVIKNSRMFFSNCTGPMNIAVAVKTPVIALLGSSDPTDWGPLGDLHISIKSPLVLEHYSEEDERKAMEMITVESVWEIIERRWKELKSN